MKMLVLKMDKQGGFPAMFFFNQKKMSQTMMLGIKDYRALYKFPFRTACFCTYQAEGKTDVRHTLVLKHGAPLTSFVSQAWEAHRIYFPVAVYTLSKLYTWTKRSFKSIERKSIVFMTRNTQIVRTSLSPDVRPKTYSLVSLWFFFCQNPCSTWWFQILVIFIPTWRNDPI